MSSSFLCLDNVKIDSMKEQQYARIEYNIKKKNSLLTSDQNELLIAMIRYLIGGVNFLVTFQYLRAGLYYYNNLLPTI